MNRNGLSLTKQVRHIKKYFATGYLFFVLFLFIFNFFKFFFIIFFLQMSIFVTLSISTQTNI